MNRSIAVLIAVALTFAAWTPLQASAAVLKILNPSPTIDDRFGAGFNGLPSITAVGGTGNNLVGVPLDGEVDRGVAYLFDGSNGDLLQTYLSPSANPLTFGRAVATLSTDRQIVREDPQFVDHIQVPDNVRVLLFIVHLCLVRTVVLTVVKTLCVYTH